MLFAAGLPIVELDVLPRLYRKVGIREKAFPRTDERALFVARNHLSG